MIGHRPGGPDGGDGEGRDWKGKLPVWEIGTYVEGAGTHSCELLQ